MKMFVTCFSTAPSVTTSTPAIELFVRPSAISSSTSRSRGESCSSGSWRPLRTSSCDTTSGARAAPPAGGDPPQRVQEVAHVGHAVLEQVADAAAVAGQEVHGVALLDVLGE